MERDILIHTLKKQKDTVWDVLVIGGGATGLGIALDSVTRGFKTILMDKSDFSQGTSSRSTKLVHGGVRYLAQGDILLVIEALHERGRMLKNAPHVTSNQEFIIPLYRRFDIMLYYFGLKFYDILSGRLSLGKSYFISREKTLERLPNIKREGLKGGIVYHDGQFDDSRMAMDIAHMCVEKGGLVLNYFNVYGLIKDNKGKVYGVRCFDKYSGDLYDIRAKAVINATGVFADDILRLDNPGNQKIIRPSQGVHLVVDRSFLSGDSAIMIPKTDDGRVLFAIPWHEKVVIGTTDTPLENIDEEPVALDKEIDFILSTAGRYLVKHPGRKDILSVFAGLRPLASDPDNPQSTKEISRRHKIIVSKSGLITVTGGKWTTYRMMAEETLNKAVDVGLIEKRVCITRNLSVLKSQCGLTDDQYGIYGDKAPEIRELISGDPSLNEKLCDELPYTLAEIIWICRNEMPVALEDVLARRTRALLLDARASNMIAAKVASLMASELGNDQKWIDDQVEKYGILVEKYICISNS